MWVFQSNMKTLGIGKFFDRSGFFVSSRSLACQTVYTENYLFIDWMANHKRLQSYADFSILLENNLNGLEKIVEQSNLSFKKLHTIGGGNTWFHLTIDKKTYCECLSMLSIWAPLTLTAFGSLKKCGKWSRTTLAAQWKLLFIFMWHTTHVCRT